MIALNELLVNKEASIKEVMRTIGKTGLRIALVVDDDRKLLGVVTDGDIRRGIIKGNDISDEISSIMNHHPIYCFTDAEENYLIDLIKAQKLLGIPIVNKDKVVQDFALMEVNRLSFLSRSTLKVKPVDKVLVIGGGGYIGSVLVKKLLSKGYKVRILDIFIYGKEHLQDIRDPNLEIVKGDTRHVETLTNCVKDVDAAVHLAELVGDPACDLDPKTTQDVNYLATMLVASVCKHYQINRLVYLSSCSVYGASKGEELLDEESHVNPVSLYAKMKLNSENILREMSDENFSPTILRLSTVYGLSPRARFDLVVNTLTGKAVKEGKITIFGGDQWRPNVHVADVAKAIILSLEAPLEKVANNVFNVGSEVQNYTINQIGELVKQQIPTASLLIEDRDVDKRNYRVSFKRIRETLGFQPDHSLVDGIQEIKKALDEGVISDYKDLRYSNVRFLEEKGEHI